MPAETAPGAICVCGHEWRWHFGGGTCIRGYVDEKGKALASVCPCSRFRERTD